jgi:hypothetical protein
MLISWALVVVGIGRLVDGGVVWVVVWVVVVIIALFFPNAQIGEVLMGLFRI